MNIQQERIAILMNSHKKKRIKSNRGDAMILVLCIMAILITLCLAMLLASSVLMNNVQNKEISEQCRVSAVTIAKELDKGMLESKDTASLYQYLRSNISLTGGGAWPYYNPDEWGHGETAAVYRDMEMTNTQFENTGNIALRMYWTWEHNAMFNKEYGEIELHLEITAEKRGQKHTISSQYGLSLEKGDPKGTWYWNLLQRN
ncbi:MAG: hypothetical protein RSC76_04935 [Oscillospiraceae bacterium]